MTRAELELLLTYIRAEVADGFSVTLTNAEAKELLALIERRENSDA